MNTPSHLRKNTTWTQERLAIQLGIRQADVSDVELGKRDIGDAVASKWAVLLGVPGKRFKAALKTVQEAHQFVTDAEGLAGVAKSASPSSAADHLKIAAHMQRIAADPRLPEPLRQRAVKVGVDLTETTKAAVKQSSTELASGVTGSLVRQAGGNLDQYIDFQGFQVINNGDGTAWLVDASTDPPSLTLLPYTDLVALQGTPAGSKSATKSSIQSKPGRNVAGHRLRG